MILDKLVLHDFGIFGGYHEIELAPSSAKKPVILFGGLNGSGKTTLLDAIQLCLFGPVAKCSNRGSKSYTKFLAGCIHKQALRKEALIGLDFRHVVQGKETKYSIRRSWRANGKNAVEDFSVRANDNLTDVLTNNWLHHIEDIIPANLSHLFFFDGEQASEYVMADSARELIETAVLNLLGLDIVDQLTKDLKIIERRETASSLNEIDKAEIDLLEEESGQLQNEISKLQQEIAEYRSYKLVPKQNEFEEITQLFKKTGGDLYDRKEEIEANLESKQKQHSEIKGHLIKLADTALPFILVKNLLRNLEVRDRDELIALQAKREHVCITEIKLGLLAHLQKNKASKTSLVHVETYLDDKLSTNKTLLNDTVQNLLDDHTRKALQVLLGAKLDQSASTAATAVSDFAESARRRIEIELEWAGIPKEDEIQSIQSRLNECKAELEVRENCTAELEARIETLRRQHEYIDSKLQAKLKANAEIIIEQKDKARLLAHSAKARETLSNFRQAVTQKHINHIQSIVLENYQLLLRKNSLISRVAIDHNTFDVTLRDSNNHTIPIDKLSAGERQLLAISVLWAMAKASGRPLPTAIDTPMGRLDAIHRKYLVQRYFPNASHQVLLFSTDQEIYDEYYDDLLDKVGRSYRLEYDEKTSSTKVSLGYFQ